MTTSYKFLIADRIKETLKEKKITQTQLAKHLNKSTAYISNIMKGRYSPKVNELMKISEILEKPVGHFIGEENLALSRMIEKSHKWDRLLSVLQNDIRMNKFNEIIPIPIFDYSDFETHTLKELKELKKHPKQFIHLTTTQFSTYFNYDKNIKDLFAIKLLVRDYPDFDLYKGNMVICEEFDKKDIDKNPGKLFGVAYKGVGGFKRIFKQKDNYYFEPNNTAPNLKNVKIDDPNLIINMRVISSITVKNF